MDNRLKENFGVALVVLVLSVSLSGNVLQYRAVNKTNGEAAGFESGQTFPILSGLDRQGVPIRLEIRRPTIAYVFSPNCGWCKEDYPNLQALERLVGGKYQLVAIALSNTKAPETFHDAMTAYLSLYSPPGQVLLVDPERLDPQTARDIRVTPQTVVVEANHRIQKAWVGALMGDRLADANKFFGTFLPGVGVRASAQ